MAWVFRGKPPSSERGEEEEAHARMLRVSHEGLGQVMDDWAGTFFSSGFPFAFLATTKELSNSA
jgi:hypothetical protein